MKLPLAENKAIFQPSEYNDTNKVSASYKLMNSRINLNVDVWIFDIFYF